MEMEKDANKFVEELMNRVKELFQKYSKELAHEDKEMIEGQIYEESYQEYPDEVSHVEDMENKFDEDEVLISSLPLNQDIHASSPSKNQEEKMMNCDPFKDLDDTLFHDFGSE
jgi:hypothetical protein